MDRGAWRATIQRAQHNCATNTMIPTVGGYKSLGFFFFSFLLVLYLFFMGFVGRLSSEWGGTSHHHRLSGCFRSSDSGLLGAGSPGFPSAPRVQLSIMDFFHCLFWGKADGNTQTCLNLSLAHCPHPPPPPFSLSCHLGTSL